MTLKIAVLAASILQVVAAGFLNIGSFQDTERTLQVFIQPVGWAFSIWGLIYTLAFIYAVYQIIPQNDNPTLQKTRTPALVGFLGSIAWLYFAGMSNWALWLTAPVLFLMAISFIYVVKAPDSSDKKQTLLSKKILFPYAAWTGIACWLNVQTLLNDQSIVNTDMVNMITNSILFVCIAVFTFYYFKKTNFSAWYGGVMVWAGIGVVYANLNEGSLFFAVLGGLLSVSTAGLYVKRKLKK
jgi:hypothetical protein